MDYILLCNYTPFKTGQRVRLPDGTATKLLSEGVIRRADEPMQELRKPWRWGAMEKVVPTPIPAKETPSLLERAIIHEMDEEDLPKEKKKGPGRKR